MDRSLAVLLTCFNRKDKTKRCLQHLEEAALTVTLKLDVYLVDDGSTDGTATMVRENFPFVNIISGTGNLFWNKGMRLAWNSAYKNRSYDFYLLLNDDTNLEKWALKELIGCYDEKMQVSGLHSVVTGACKEAQHSNVFSYGGKDDVKSCVPNGEIQECLYVNGNALLVPKEIFKVVGNLSADYTHAMGDFDYGLRTLNQGFACITTRQYIAVCPSNKQLPDFANPKVRLSKRFKSLYSPTGLNLKEYNTFRRKFWGNKWVIYAIKAYVKVLFPSLVNRFGKQ